MRETLNHTGNWVASVRNVIRVSLLELVAISPKPMNNRSGHSQSKLHHTAPDTVNGCTIHALGGVTANSSPKDACSEIPTPVLLTIVNHWLEIPTTEIGGKPRLQGSVCLPARLSSSELPQPEIYIQPATGNKRMGNLGPSLCFYRNQAATYLT